MERSEIVAGLRNAIDRGYSIDLAIQSFISAGYNKQDVLDSAASIGGVMMQHPQLSQPQITPLPQSQSTQEIKQNIQLTQLGKIRPTQFLVQSVIPSTPQSPPQLPQIQISEKKSNKSLLLVIILIVVLVILLSVLGITIFARDWISSLFGLK
jgi:hypothetical protein